MFHRISLLFFLVLAGCQTYVPTTDAQRTHSFEPYIHAEIDGTPLNQFLSRKTAILLSSDALGTAESHPNNIELGFPARHGLEAQAGHAVPIASDGYFLTAAHLVSGSKLYLIFFDGKSTRVEPAEVVANSSATETHLDFAILHVNCELPGIFELADDEHVHLNQPVIAVGSSIDTTRSKTTVSIVQTCLAGKIVALFAEAEGNQTIVSDIPVRLGDSGGPLVSLDGKLLGIVSQAASASEENIIGIIKRPTAGWIAGTIEKDRAHPHQTLPPVAATRPSSTDLRLEIQMWDDTPATLPSWSTRP